MKLLMKQIILSFLVFAGIAATSPMLRAADASPPSTAPKDSERIDALEAYVTNGDPSAAFKAYKDKDGNLPKDFKAAMLGTSGSSGERSAPVTAIARTLPSLI